jgi:hypothetical protein
LTEAPNVFFTSIFGTITGPYQAPYVDALIIPTGTTDYK